MGARGAPERQSVIINDRWYKCSIAISLRPAACDKLVPKEPGAIHHLIVRPVVSRASDTSCRLH